MINCFCLLLCTLKSFFKVYDLKEKKGLQGYCLGLLDTVLHITLPNDRAIVYPPRNT